MSEKPQFTWFTAEELIAGAGGDPWEIVDQLRTGDAGAINGLAEAFHTAGAHVKDADEQFNQAKERFTQAYSRNNGSEHPINDSAEVQRMGAKLAGHPESLANIAATLEQTVAELNTALHSIDAEIGSYGVQIPLVIEQLYDYNTGKG